MTELEGERRDRCVQKTPAGFEKAQEIQPNSPREHGCPEKQQQEQLMTTAKLAGLLRARVSPHASPLLLSLPKKSFITSLKFQVWKPRLTSSEQGLPVHSDLEEEATGPDNQRVAEDKERGADSAAGPRRGGLCTRRTPGTDPHWNPKRVCNTVITVTARMTMARRWKTLCPRLPRALVPFRFNAGLPSLWMLLDQD